MGSISSLQNPRVKAAVRLRNARARQEQQRFLIDGAREIGRAWHSGVRFEEVFYCPSVCTSPQRQELIAAWRSSGVDLWEVTPPVLEKLCFGDRHEGLLVVASAEVPTLEQLKLPENPLLAVLEGVQKPGNLGAVLRSADGAGVSAVIAADLQTDLYNPNAIRASLGTLFQVPLAVASTEETLAWLSQSDWKIYAARPDCSLIYTQADFAAPSALVLGSEAEGLSVQWDLPQVTGIRIPMLGIADSLNVSVSASVLFYEALRQRTA